MSNDSFSFPSASSSSGAETSGGGLGTPRAGEMTGTPSSTTTTTSPGDAPRSDLLGRVVETAHTTIDRLAERAAPHVGKLEGSVGGAGEMLGERADQVREMGAEWVDTLRNSVREHPVAAVGIALAVGMLLARTSR